MKNVGLLVALMVGAVLIGAMGAVSAENSNSCTLDSDCEAKFSNCGCANVCVLKSQNNGIDCARACTIEESNTTEINCECENNQCVGKTAGSGSGCRNYYWFDSTNKSCSSQKQFCGTYMYRGLQTFGTKGECQRELNKTEDENETDDGDKIACAVDSDCLPALMMCGDPTGPNYNYCIENQVNFYGLRCINGECKMQNKSLPGEGKVKILPEVASERARERLGELGFNVTLKEVGTGNGNETKMVYEVSGEKEGKMLGLFKIKGKVSVEVDADTGEVIRERRPWWAFLASGI